MIIILDNSPVHKTNNAKNLFKKVKAIVLFLSPYSPQFYSDRNVLWTIEEIFTENFW